MKGATPSPGETGRLVISNDSGEYPLSEDNNDVLDEILSDAPEPVAEETEKQEQPRGPDGKFAPKEADEPKEPQAEPVAHEPAQPEGRTVPLAALHAERESRQALEARLEEAQRQLQQVMGQVQMLSQQRPAAPQEQPKRVEIWEDPEGFVKSAVSPIEQQVNRKWESVSRMLAVQTHGQETVQTAYQAMGEAMQRGDRNAAFEYRRIMASEHPYDELVSWHRRNTTMQKIGGDPDAWLEAELQKRMADPEFQAKVIEAARGTAAKSNGQGAPQVALPPSLNRVPGAGSEARPADMSSEGLFNHAMASR